MAGQEVLVWSCQCGAAYRTDYGAGEGEVWWAREQVTDRLLTVRDVNTMLDTKISISHYFNVTKAHVGTVFGKFLGEDCCGYHGVHYRHYRLFNTKEEAAEARGLDPNTNNVVKMYDYAEQIRFAMYGGNVILWRPVGVTFFRLDDRELEGWRAAAEAETRVEVLPEISNNNNLEEDGEGGAAGGGDGAVQYRAVQQF